MNIFALPEPGLFVKKIAVALFIIFSGLQYPVNGVAATPCEFDGRLGSLKFTNDSLYPVHVRLVHSVTNQYYPNASHYWEVKAGQTRQISAGAGLSYGSSWGIRIGSAKIRCLGSAGGWDPATSTFLVSVSSYHK